MDWTGPNASVAAGNALLDKKIGEDIMDIAKHVYQLAQGLRSVDGTDTGLTGFDMEFAVRNVFPNFLIPMVHIYPFNRFILTITIDFHSIHSSLRRDVKILIEKRRFMLRSEEKMVPRTAMLMFCLVRILILFHLFFFYIYVVVRMIPLDNEVRLTNFFRFVKPTIHVWSWNRLLEFLARTMSTPIISWCVFFL
jgi:hypothetical protein